MIIFAFLKSLFAAPQFSAGDRVNYVPHGNMALTDGYVLGQSGNGVMVEFPRSGIRVMSPHELSRIC